MRISEAGRRSQLGKLESCQILTCVYGSRLCSVLKKSSRLGQWDGRRRSSRSEEPVLPQLVAAHACCGWRRAADRAGATLPGLCLGPAAALSASARSVRYDLRARVYFELVNQAQTERSATRPSIGCRPSSAATRRPASSPPASRRSSIATRPARCWCSAASRSPNAVRPCCEGEAELTRRAAAPPTTSAAAPPCSSSSACCRALVVLYVVRFQPSLAQSLPKIIGVCVPGADHAGARPVS